MTGGGEGGGGGRGTGGRGGLGTGGDGGIGEGGVGGLGGVVQGKGYVPRVFDRRMAAGESDWQRQP